MQTTLPFITDETINPLAAWCTSIAAGTTATSVANPAPAENKQTNPFEVRFEFPPKINEAEKAIADLKERVYEKHGYVREFLLTFSQPVTLQKNRRKTVTSNKAKVGIFVSTKGNFCYTFAKRSGYVFDATQIGHLRSVVPVLPEDKTAADVKKVLSFANRIHPNAWAGLKEEIIADPESYVKNYGPTVTSITGKFPDYVLEGIKEAFRNKTEYKYRSYTNGKSGRDLSVEIKPYDDGSLRAWFTSEFSGCANGDYWLLINPTTAIFKERD